MKPNNNSNLGLTGNAFVLKNINKGAFMHTYSQAQNFPYQEMKFGTTLTIKPNLSTVPQTYGLYFNDTYVCDVGSPLQNKFMELSITELPLPSLDLLNEDKDFYKELASYYLDYRGKFGFRPDSDEPMYLDVQDLNSAQEIILKATSLGYLPTELILKDHSNVNKKGFLISHEAFNLERDFPNLDISNIQVIFYNGNTEENLDLYLQTYPKLKELGLLP